MGNYNHQNPFGYELGTQFTRHHQVIDYVKHVASSSAYATTKTYGKTYEGRTLQLVYLSSPENLAQLEAMRKDHLRSIGYVQGARETSKEFSVVWLSYNVHGNESTSTEAALKTLHTLVTEKQEWLENLVVIMDPCINPDGRDRYVNWYNQVKVHHSISIHVPTNILRIGRADAITTTTTTSTAIGLG